MILSFSFEGCFLFFFRSFYRFFYDRIRKAAALQGSHHKVAAAAESGEIARSRYESYLRMHEEASRINDWE